MNVAKPAIQTFGKYQILERIATGGMAEIYKARLEGIGGFQRTFAIKRILPNLSQNGEYIAMLVDEAKVAGLLSHANIVQILDLGQVDGIWYIAMEYVHGRDLGAVLRRAKKKGLCLPVPHTVFIAIELLKGLEYAHQRQVMRGGRPVALNIIHRDVSPPNVLLSFQGEVKLTDFGIARASLKAMETVTGIVKGRFDYMSPEQAAGSKDLDQRSDLFSVGVVLYEMLTGHHPFRTDNEIGTIERVRTGKYIPVSQRNPEVPFTLETIVDRALQVTRDDRYPSATAFKEALDKFFHDAGFIFTHATLASYVRGLFPEAATRPGKPSNPGAATTAKQNRPGVDPQEGPTRRLDRKNLGPTLQAVGAAPAGRSQDIGTPAPPQDRPNPTPTTSGRAMELDSRPSPLADLLQTDEHETMIRKPVPPAGWEDEPATQLRPQPWDEAETVIRKAGPELDELLNERSASGITSSSGLRKSAAVVGTSGSGLGRRSASGSSKRPGATGRSAPRWLGWVASILALVIGLGAGAFFTAVAAGLIAGYGYSGQEPPPIASTPTIEVIAPMGTQILLNGEAVGKEITVEPNKIHRLEVTIRGHEPWTTEVKLGPGETRVFVVTAVETKVKGREAAQR